MEHEFWLGQGVGVIGGMGFLGPRAIAYEPLSTVIPAKAGIQWLKSSMLLRKCSLRRCLDSGFRRSDGVGISYAIALVA